MYESFSFFFRFKLFLGKTTKGLAFGFISSHQFLLSELFFVRREKKVCSAFTLQSKAINLAMNPFFYLSRQLSSTLSPSLLSVADVNRQNILSINHNGKLIFGNNKASGCFLIYHCVCGISCKNFQNFSFQLKTLPLS